MNKIVLKRNCVTAIVITAAAFALSIKPAAAGGPEYSLDDFPLGQQAWLSFCEPTFRTDALGVKHWVFKHKGCEFGPYTLDANNLNPKTQSEPQVDISTEKGIRSLALKIFPSQAEDRAKWTAEKLSEQKDREQGDNLNVYIKR